MGCHGRDTNLGVRHALSYKPALEMHRIGPDILPNVNDKLLSNLGISAGDSIHLKKGSVAWWNRADVKRKRSNTSASSDKNPDQQSSKRLSYKKKYHDAGDSVSHPRKSGSLDMYICL